MFFMRQYSSRGFLALTRRKLLSRCRTGIFALALGGLLTQPAAATWGEYQLPEKAEQNVFVAPGPQTGLVIDFLNRIIDGSQEHQKFLKNVRVAGRVSWVSQPTSLSSRLSIDPHQLTPEWRNFLYVQQGVKRRYEEDYTFKVDDREQKGRIYRLVNSQALYHRLQVNGLDIEKLPPDHDTWLLETHGFTFHSSVSNGLYPMSVVGACNYYIDQLTGKSEREYFRRTNRFLKCYEKNGLLIVENVHGSNSQESKLGYRYSFSVDPSQGYSVVEARTQIGAPGKGVFTTTQTKNVSSNELFISEST